MIVLIYVKWWFPVDPYAEVGTVNPVDLTISTSPSIITLLIGDVMGLTGFSTPNDENLLYFSAQQSVSNILVYITFICLPVMLCAIPCIQICCGPKHHDEVPDEFAGVSAHNNGDDDERRLIGGDENDIGDIEEMLEKHCPKEGDHGGVGEIFIHQIIETIEFVLGCISNTASYLRLWALSLAHGQLGEVFLSIFFTQAAGGKETFFADMSSAVAVFYFFIVTFGYMFAVFCVLLMMDSLEVFLHTMRLHWVEFMGKFFEGAGVPYKPFSFTEVFEKEQSRVDTTK